MYTIYLYDQPVGRLITRGTGIRFTYDARAPADDAMPAISLSMPKRDEPYGGKVARAFFLNLLPEGAYKRLVEQMTGTSAGNDSGLLGAIGGECPGAIAIWPEDQRPPAIPHYEPLTVADLSQLFDPANATAIASATRRARLSLAGVQEKIALYRDDTNNWLRPLDGAITSHILKQPAAAFPELLENELFCMTLADRAGLDVAPVGLPALGVRVFCTERFDRVRTAGAPDAAHPRIKLHQEDFCQILSALPSQKYQDEGGPGLKQCADVLSTFTALPIEDITRLIRWVGFNYIIGNEDAHAKNLALLYLPNRELRLAPHYDLVSTEAYPDLDRGCAMKVGRATTFGGVQATDWKRVAEMLDLPWPAAREELRLLASQVEHVLVLTQRTCKENFGSANVYHVIATLARQRIARIMADLVR
jgi:serine/threonine-protein kinase HipA